MTMSLQAMFNKAVEGLASQGFKQAELPNGGCAYRAPNGAKCALGHLISDAEYKPAFEGHDVYTLESELPWIRRNADELDDLQFCHDHAKNPSDMRGRLRNYACEYSLTIPEVLSQENDNDYR